tara:strand:+ start:39 stop:317 length:279 start_codon:yes stop_codon:yes gene_type:complete
MSTLTEISDSKTIVVIKEKEGFLQSFFKDLVTFSFIAFCVYISQESTWWTFVTGGMFLMFALMKVGNIINKSTNTFESKQKAIDFLSNKESK